MPWRVRTWRRRTSSSRRSTRRYGVTVPGLGPVVLADTVGFVRRLPHKLVAAFKATLEEVTEADVLSHVLDASDPAMDARREQVDAVLAEIGAGDVPRVEVANKIDRVDGALPRVEPRAREAPARVWLSAREGRGLGGVLQVLAGELGGAVRVRAWLRPDQGRLRAHLYAQRWVEEERADERGNLELMLQLPERSIARVAEAGALLEHARGGGEGVPEPPRVAALRAGS